MTIFIKGKTSNDKGKLFLENAISSWTMQTQLGNLLSPITKVKVNKINDGKTMIIIN